MRRIVHIGVGVRGAHWLEIVRGHPGITSVACVDADGAALRRVREKYPELAGACYPQVEEVPGRLEADGAIIASPPSDHAAHCIAALEAGWAVLVEKPFVANTKEALRVIAHARELQKPVVVGQSYRFSPAERTVRTLVQQGQLGRIMSATCHTRRRRPGAGTFLGTMSYPQLMEAAVHDFDSLRGMLGLEPVSITARMGNPPWSDYAHGAVTAALIEMDGGVPVDYLGTLASHRDEYHLHIDGTRGALVTDRKRVWWRKSGGRFFRPIRRIAVPRGDARPYPRQGTASLLEAVRDAVLKGSEPETSGSSDLYTIAMLDAARRSEQEQRSVSIREILDDASAEIALAAARLS